MNKKITVLVICSDDRASTIAQWIGEQGTVYQQVSASNAINNGANVKYKIFDGLWKDTSDEARDYDVLFYHASERSTNPIPDGCKFTLGFIFSGPGLSPGTTTKRTANASKMEEVHLTNIVNVFQRGNSPFIARHLNEIQSILLKKRTESPSFCGLERFPYLTALMILLLTFRGLMHHKSNDSLSNDQQKILEQMKEQRWWANTLTGKNKGSFQSMQIQSVQVELASVIECNPMELKNKLNSIGLWELSNLIFGSTSGQVGLRVDNIDNIINELSKLVGKRLG